MGGIGPLRVRGGWVFYHTALESLVESVEVSWRVSTPICKNYKHRGIVRKPTWFGGHRSTICIHLPTAGAKYSRRLKSESTGEPNMRTLVRMSTQVQSTPYCTELHCTVLYKTILHSTLLHYNKQHYILYHTTLFQTLPYHLDCTTLYTIRYDSELQNYTVLELYRTVRL